MRTQRCVSTNHGYRLYATRYQGVVVYEIVCAVEFYVRAGVSMCASENWLCGASMRVRACYPLRATKQDYGTTSTPPNRER